MRDAQIATIRERLKTAADAFANDQDPALTWDDLDARSGRIGWLCARLELTATEALVVLLLVAHERCSRVRRYMRELNAEPVADPTLDAIRRVVYGGRDDLRAWRELGPAGALHRFALVEWIEASGPDHRRTLRVASRVLAAFHGEVALDRELAGCATLGVEVAGPLEVAPGVEARVRAAVEGGGFVVLHGSTGTGRRSLLTRLAQEQGLALLQVDTRSLSTDRDGARRQLRLIARECRLLDATPLLLHLEALAAVGEVPDRLDLVEAELSGRVLATGARVLSRRWRTPPTTIELPPLSGSQLASLWSRALPQASSGDADLLATMYPLAPALVEAVGAVARRDRGTARCARSTSRAGCAPCSTIASPGSRRASM